MVLKRQLKKGEEGTSGLPNKRRHFASTLLKGQNHGRTVQESMSCLEPILRKMVQEAVEQAVNRVISNQVEYPATRSLHLQFHTTLPETLFTGHTLLSKDRSRIKLVLYDTVSRQIVTSSPLSSLKVKIVVLDGDFGSDDTDWTKDEFVSKLVKTREGKRPLLAGETTVTLKDGVGYVGELSFTDNSKWRRSGQFRLGSTPQANSKEISIREGVSNAFRVKDHRGESYQKHYPPALGDEVWRLERIAKDGPSHKKLNASGILSVGDFLRISARDQSKLRAILEVSNKTWETIMRHARRCDVGEKVYMYRTTRGVLFFNSIEKFVGVNFDGVSYHPADTLTSFQMMLVEEMKQQAYNNLAQWIPVSDAPVSASPMLMESVAVEGFLNSNLGLLGLNFQEQDQNGIGSTIQPPYHSVVGQENSSYHMGESSNCPPQGGFNSSFRNSFSITDPLTEFCFGEERQLAMNDAFQVESSPWQGNEVFPDQGKFGISIISSDSGLLMAKTGNPKARWCKVLAVVKWRILVRRNVAARKCKRLYN